MINISRSFFRFCLFIVFFFILKSAYSNSPNDPKSQKVTDTIYKETYHFNFHKVDSLIFKYDVLYKNNLEFNLAVVNYYWWRLISGEENGKYADQVSERIKSIEATYSGRNIKNSDEELFLLISIFAYNARISLADNSYFAAISDLSKYYSFLKLSIGSEPKYNPFYLTSGLFIFFSGLAKEKAPVFSPILNQYSKGNMETGVQYLKIAAASENWKISQEANYFLLKINFDVYRNYSEAAKYCNHLIGIYPENLLFQFYMLRISLALDQVIYAKTRMAIIVKTANSNNQLTTNEKEFYIKQAKSEIDVYAKKKKQSTMPGLRE